MGTLWGLLGSSILGDAFGARLPSRSPPPHPATRSRLPSSSPALPLRRKPALPIRTSPRLNLVYVALEMRLVILLLAGAAVLALASCGGQHTNGSPAPAEGAEQPTTSSTDSERDRLATYRDKERGLEVSYPSDWYRSEERLTPDLADPKEILSLGTYPLRQGGDRCAHYPVNALEDLGPDDAFISVLERAPPYPAAGYPARPARSDGRLDKWVSFSDNGRAFYLLVALGEAASEETKAELLTILNSLSFD